MTKPTPKWKTKGGRGRPRQDGERFECGKLKPQPAGPNERTVEIRAALLGIADRNWSMVGANTVVFTNAKGEMQRIDLSKGENALDVMLQRRWISEDDHRCGRRYAGLFGRAGVALPSMAVSHQEEASERSGVGKGDWREMTDSEKAAVFDAAFSVERVFVDNQGDPEANATLRAIWKALSPEQAAQLFEVCVLQWWPAWCVCRLTDRVAGDLHERKREALLTGLRVARTVFGSEDWRRSGWMPKPAAERPQRYTGPKVEQHLRFVDEAGEALEMRSERGRPFEVSRMVRRA